MVMAIGFLAVYCVQVVLPATRTTTNGFAAYYTASYLLAHSPQQMDRIYDDAWFRTQIARAGIRGVRDIFNIQPPTMALILWPLAGLSPGIARLIWTLCSLVFLLGGVALLAHRLGLSRRQVGGIYLLCLLYAPAMDNLREGQVYLLLFFWLCLVFWALGPFPPKSHPSQADGVAGTALGLMLVLKTGAAWLWPLLLLGGRWRSLLWAAAISAGVALVTLPWFGLEVWRLYGLQLPLLATMPERYVTAYQTTTSLFGHVLIYDPVWNPQPIARCAWLAKALTGGVWLLSLYLSARWGRLREPQQEVRMLTLALFGALIAANSPLGTEHHTLFVLPSLIVAFWWAWRAELDRDVWLLLILAALLLGAPLSYLSHRLEGGWLALLAYPRVYGAYLLWGWLGWALHSLSVGAIYCAPTQTVHEDGKAKTKGSPLPQRRRFLFLLSSRRGG